MKTGGIKKTKVPERQTTPGERTAKCLVAVFDWMMDLISSFKLKRPPGRVVKHSGQCLPDAVSIRMPRILLVEDNPQTAQAFADVIRHYYLFGEVSIYIAYGFSAAVSFFGSEDIKLVIMDSDLNDEQGDGALLTKKFVSEKPSVPVLANSNSRMSSLKMEANGAVESIGKSYARLQTWLKENDPTGSRGY